MCEVSEARCLSLIMRDRACAAEDVRGAWVGPGQGVVRAAPLTLLSGSAPV